VWAPFITKKGSSTEARCWSIALVYVLTYAIAIKRALSSKRRRSQMARNREKSNDPWYVKVAFSLFLCVLSLVALYSGVPVVQFVTRGL
jgi:hypothetical protein